MGAKLFSTDLDPGEFSAKAHCIVRLQVSLDSGPYQLIMTTSVITVMVIIIIASVY